MLICLYSADSCRMLLWRTFQEPNKSEMRKAMTALAANRTSVPQIWIGQKHIGGCDDLKVILLLLLFWLMLSVTAGDSFAFIYIHLLCVTLRYVCRRCKKAPKTSGLEDSPAPRRHNPEHVEVRGVPRTRSRIRLRSDFFCVAVGECRPPTSDALSSRVLCVLIDVRARVSGNLSFGCNRPWSLQGTWGCS